MRLRLLFLTLALCLSACAAAEPWRWSGIERIVAISDVHGAYGAMVETLQSAGVLDEQERWSGGAAHLVIAGDVLDRGPDSRRVLDLLMRLEGEAAAAGGRVHMLLGNHEVMNLTGDLRYVSAAEFAAFADEEPPGARARALAAFKAAHGGEMDDTRLQSAFAERAPPGFFGHRQAFAPDGRYGRWLLEQPFIVVLNDTAFVHGGLSPIVTDAGLEGVNGRMKAGLIEYLGLLQELVNAGVLDLTDGLHRQEEILHALPGDPERPPQLEQAIARAIELQNAPIHDVTSPIWYRGNVACGALIESDKLDAALERIGAARVVLGHTPTSTGTIQTRLHGRVIEIDTGMLTSHYGGSGHALLIEGRRLLVAQQKRGGTSPPVPQPRRLLEGADALTASELERVLATGKIAASPAGDADPDVVEVRLGDSVLAARFAERPRGRGFYPEVAAYRLDRLLDLGMVPVTVLRELDGDDGWLQALPQRATDETARRASNAGYGAWCPLTEQWQALYVFDALIGNAARHAGDILYSPEDWQLMLTGHARAFSSRDERPEYLEKVELHLGPAWVRALRSLSDEVLQAKLGDVLDERRLRALAERRDELLAEAPGGRTAAPPDAAPPTGMPAAGALAAKRRP